MLYAAKCYWPGITTAELEPLAGRATRYRPRGVTYRGSLLFAGDDLVLCLFEGPSSRVVKHAAEDAGLPCERLMESIYLPPSDLTKGL
jgi:hypothetical protein